MQVLTATVGLPSARLMSFNIPSPWPSILKHLLKVEGVQQNDSLTE